MCASHCTYKMATKNSFHLLTELALVGVLLIAVPCIESVPITSKVNVSVYYESLCPDSRDYFVKYLNFTSTDLEKYVNLQLFPYGKSSYSPDNGDFKFKCDHGDNECKGNKIHACALKLIKKPEQSTKSGVDNVTLAYITCLMEKANANKETDFLKVSEECAKKHHVDNKQIIECANSSEGSKYLVSIGTFTEKWKLHYIPTIIINDHFNETLRESAKVDFKSFEKILCDNILSDDKPTVCNGAAAMFMGLLMILATLKLHYILA